MNPKKEWTAEEIIALYSNGYSDIEVIKAMGATRKQFDKMYAISPNFREMVDKGRDYSEAWNLEQSRLNLQNKDFNTSLFSKRMENLYGWAQKIESKNSNVTADLTQEEVLARLAASLPGVLHLLPKDQQKEVAKLVNQSNKEVDGEYQEVRSDD